MVAVELVKLNIGDREMAAKGDKGYLLTHIMMGYVVKCGALWDEVVM